MDPAIAVLDLVKAGAIIASMVESYLAAGAPPLEAKGADDDDGQDHRPAPVADGLCLHPPIDGGPGPVQSGEHRTAVQSGEQGAVARVGEGADSDPRSRSRTIGCPDNAPRGLQVAGQRCGHGQRRRDLLARGLPPRALEPGLASPARAVRDHQHARHRRGRLLRPDRVQRRPRARHEGHIRPGRAAHHSHPPARRQTQQGAQGRAALPVAGRLRLRRREDRARSRSGGAGRRSDRVRAVREGGHGIRGRATLPQARSALSAPLPMVAPGTANWCGAASPIPACSASWPTRPMLAPTSSVATSRASILRRRARSAPSLA